VEARRQKKGAVVRPRKPWVEKRKEYEGIVVRIIAGRHSRLFGSKGETSESSLWSCAWKWRYPRPAEGQDFILSYPSHLRRGKFSNIQRGEKHTRDKNFMEGSHFFRVGGSGSHPRGENCSLRFEKKERKRYT